MYSANSTEDRVLDTKVSDHRPGTAKIVPETLEDPNLTLSGCLDRLADFCFLGVPDMCLAYPFTPIGAFVSAN